MRDAPLPRLRAGAARRRQWLAGAALAGVTACNGISGIGDFRFDRGTEGACDSAVECPDLEGAEPDCAPPACVDGRCGFDLAPPGTLTSEQPAEECMERVCNGAGDAELHARPAGTPCGVTQDHCTGTGVCTAACDQQGLCGDTDSGCSACAVTGACADELAACTGSAEWSDYSNCVASCGMMPSCITGCANQFPNGAALDDALRVCVYCDECPVDCAGSCPM